MKTAEELSVELLKMSGATDKEIEFCKIKSPNQFKKVQVWIKQIQLDAMKDGMRRAGLMCDEEFYEHNELTEKDL